MPNSGNPLKSSVVWVTPKNLEHFRPTSECWLLPVLALIPPLRWEIIFEKYLRLRYERQKSSLLITSEYLSAETEFSIYWALCSNCTFPQLGNKLFHYAQHTLEPENLIDISNIKKRLLGKRNTFINLWNSRCQWIRIKF